MKPWVRREGQAGIKTKGVWAVLGSSLLLLLHLGRRRRLLLIRALVVPAGAGQAFSKRNGRMACTPLSRGKRDFST